MSCTAEILDILTYDHSPVDILLNYLALFVTFLPVLYIHHHMVIKSPYQYCWIIVTLFLVIFQIVLCLIVHCRGISIIWSSFCGYSFMISNVVRNNRKIRSYNQSKSVEIILLSCSFIFSIILWIYYAIVSDLLTTIAHLCAVLLGALIGEIFLRVSIQYTDNIFQLLPQS